VFADEKSATTKSSLPSPLKSPAAMPLAPIGAGKSILGWNAPSPLPSKMDTVFEVALTTAISTLPSPLKSPRAANDGAVPRYVIDVRLERAVAIAQQNRNGVVGEVCSACCDEIKRAVPVEVAYGHSVGRWSSRILHVVLKCSIAVA